MQTGKFRAADAFFGCFWRFSSILSDCTHITTNVLDMLDAGQHQVL